MAAEPLYRLLNTIPRVTWNPKLMIWCRLINKKKKHRQLRTVICGRCRLLSHGNMITAVDGNGSYAGGKQFITAEELREKLSHLRHEKALIVKLVDVVDFNGSFLNRIRDIAGANPIILVVTKVDLLPKGTDLNCVGDWVVEATIMKKLNVISVHLTSSKSLVGIAGVVSKIQRQKKLLLWDFSWDCTLVFHWTIGNRDDLTPWEECLHSGVS